MELSKIKHKELTAHDLGDVAAVDEHRLAAAGNERAVRLPDVEKIYRQPILRLRGRIQSAGTQRKKQQKRKKQRR